MTIEVYSILYAEEEWKVTGTSSVTSSGSTLPVAGEPGKLCLVIFDQVWVQMRSHDIALAEKIRGLDPLCSSPVRLLARQAYVAGGRQLNNSCNNINGIEAAGSTTTPWRP